MICSLNICCGNAINNKCLSRKAEAVVLIKYEFRMQKDRQLSLAVFCWSE